MRGRHLAAFAITAVALVPAFADRAEGFVYWANNGNGTIGRANLDGSSVDQNFILGGPPEEACGVATNGSHIFWANESDGWISRANLDGSNIDFNFITGATEACGVAVNATHIFWAYSRLEATGLVGGIGRANLDGSNVDHDFIEDVLLACGVTVNATHVFWANASASGRIGRAELDGGNVEQEFILEPAGIPNPCGVAVNGSHIFWANKGCCMTPGNTLGRADLNGQNRELGFITGANAACGVAVNGTHIFWANQGSDTVGRANLDGSGISQSFITGANNPCGVAVGAPPVPPPASGAAGAALPSNALRFVNLKRKRKKGIAILTVFVPGPGEIGLRGPGIKPIRAGGAQASRFTSGGKVKLRIKPHQKGKKAKKLRKRLRKKGKAKRKVRVTYIPTGGLANTKKRKVKLVKK